MAAEWSAIGILAGGLFATLFYLGHRIDALGERLDARIDGLGGRIDGLSGRIDSMSDRIEEHGARLSREIYDVGAKLDDHLRRHAG